VCSKWVSIEEEKHLKEKINLLNPTEVFINDKKINVEHSLPWWMGKYATA